MRPDGSSTRSCELRGRGSAAVPVALLTLAVLFGLLLTSAYAHTIWVGKVQDGQYTLRATDAQWAIVDGDNSRLRVYWDTQTREYILTLEVSEKHAATDGEIPDMLIGSCCANQLRVRPRFPN